MSEGMQMIHDAPDSFSRPIGEKKTEYTFEIRRKVQVTLKGGDTEENQEKAACKAAAQAAREIDENWLEYAGAEEFEDFEN